MIKLFSVHLHLCFLSLLETVSYCGDLYLFYVKAGKDRLRDCRGRGKTEIEREVEERGRGRGKTELERERGRGKTELERER